MPEDVSKLDGNKTFYCCTRIPAKICDPQASLLAIHHKTLSVCNETN